MKKRQSTAGIRQHTGPVIVAAILMSPMVHSSNIYIENTGFQSRIYGDFPESSWSIFSDEMDRASGNNVFTGPFTSLSTVLSFDALVFTARESDFVNPAVPTATELANISAFIDTGRRILLIGENTIWSQWNDAILGLVGGTYSNELLNGPTSPAAGLSHELVDGISTIEVLGAGVADASPNGIPVFEENFATLWGDNSNVLTVLDSNVWEDSLIDSNNQNSRFLANVADWLASSPTSDYSIPEPTTLSLLVLSLAGLGFMRQKQK